MEVSLHISGAVGGGIVDDLHGEFEVFEKNESELKGTERVRVFSQVTLVLVRQGKGVPIFLVV